MPDISELLQYIQDEVVTPLLKFQTVTDEGDRIHTDTYKKFMTNINALFTGNPPAIRGKGASALQQKVQDYEMAEKIETGYGSGGELSSLIDQASTYCTQAGQAIQALLDNFPTFGLREAIEDSFLPPLALGNAPLIPIHTRSLRITKYIIIPPTRYMVSAEQLEHLESMGDIRATWGTNMVNLFNDPTLEPDLPDAPNNLPLSFITLPPVNLTPQQQQELNDIMGILAVQGLGNVNPQYIEELLSEGFSEADILKAIEGWKNAHLTEQQINDLLFLAAFHILLGPYYHNNMLPNGMNAQQYQNFTSALRSGLAAAGYCAGAGIGGSTVTGNKYTTGRPFDGDPNNPSDYDIALTGNTLWQKAHEVTSPRIRFRDGGTHSEPLNEAQLEELGLLNLVDQLQTIAGPGSPTGNREVHFMIYNSLTTTSARAPYMYFFGDSCSGNT